MTPAAEKQIAALNQTLSGEILITCRHTDHQQSDAIVQFCDRLSRRVAKIRVKKETGDPGDMPGIQIHDGLFYQAVPAGTEIAPFVEALQMAAAGTARKNDAILKKLSAIDLPIHMVLYVASECPFCPQAVRQLLPLASANSHIHLTVIDALSFPELAEKDSLQSVPTLILEDQFRWTGRFQTDEIVEMMVNRDPSALGPLSLEMMLKDGKAGQLAEMMLAKAQIFPAFCELLLHTKWPVRLGAMVVMDELIEKNLDLALQIIPPLWQQFNTVDDRVKGDLLYIFGQTGQKDIIPYLKKVLSADFEQEVKEAAQEALEKCNT
ncbi:MAG: thioredoxin family protein [Desulfobacterales bacterium]|jgi:thiol-disulfide isomerase/thioredoxin